jgi:ERCC4-type nuclease
MQNDSNIVWFQVGENYYAIIMDNRERAIISTNGNFQGRISIECMKTGDFKILKRVSDGSIPIMLIERKTLTDMSASIPDGRAYEQPEKMVKFRQENEGCQLYFIIEGPNTHNDDHVICNRNGITYATIIRRLDHIMMNDNIHILYTRSIAETMKRIMSLIKNYESRNEHRDRQNVVFGSMKSIENIDKNIEQNIEQDTSNGKLPDNEIKGPEPLPIVSKIWMAIPGISQKNINVIRAKYSLKTILTMSPIQENINAIAGIVRGGGRRIGPSLANKMLNFNPSKVISSINGIGAARATAIITQYPTIISDIITGKMDLDAVKSITVAGRKITKVAESLYNELKNAI